MCESARHVFLTGRKQVGKSTLIQKILDCWPGMVGGFRTIRTRAFLGTVYSVHLFCMGEEMIPREENLLFLCGQPGPDMKERFERLGCRALKKCAGCSLIVMDELGPHEAEAVRFRQEVRRLLDGSIPILGVMQAPAELYWPEAAHPAIRLLEITEENRDREELKQEILRILLPSEEIQLSGLPFVPLHPDRNT